MEEMIWYSKKDLSFHKTASLKIYTWETSVMKEKSGIRWLMPVALGICIKIWQSVLSLWCGAEMSMFLKSTWKESGTTEKERPSATELLPLFICALLRHMAVVGVSPRAYSQQASVHRAKAEQTIQRACKRSTGLHERTLFSSRHLLSAIAFF